MKIIQMIGQFERIIPMSNFDPLCIYWWYDASDVASNQHLPEIFVLKYLFQENIVIN